MGCVSCLFLFIQWLISSLTGAPLASVYVQRGEYEHALLCANAALGTAKRFHGEAARIYNTLTESFYSKVRIS